MQDVRGHYVSPSVREASFNCPHCGSLTTQFWFKTYVDHIDGDSKTPYIIRSLEDINVPPGVDAEGRANIVSLCNRALSGRPFFHKYEGSLYPDAALVNVHVSRCYHCCDLSIWLHDRMIYPTRGSAPLPNADMPPEIKADYEEADKILHHSPRGAAALLRLAIQKLCKELGCKGKSIDDDIAALVKAGLPVPIQQALDIVRVIGNNAVHPGQIDLRDDTQTAEKLFSLVNLIVQDRISNPKAVKALYDSLPSGALAAIARRDSSEG